MTGQKGALAGAVSKVYLATLSNREALDIIREKGLKKYTPSSIVDEYDCVKSLGAVRRDGYAVDDGEFISGVKFVAMSLEKFRSLSLLMWVGGFSSAMPEEKTGEIAGRMTVTARKVKLILN